MHARVHGRSIFCLAYSVGKRLYISNSSSLYSSRRSMLKEEHKHYARLTKDTNMNIEHTVTLAQVKTPTSKIE
jgi:hypothetical protein